MASDSPDHAREEFLAEAQELIETLARDLLLLDQGRRDGEPEPDLLSALFRGVHTLKGLAGMFGFARLGKMAHVLEDLLDQVRLGRTALSAEAMDVLFEGVEGFEQLLVEAKQGVAARLDLESFGQRVRAAIDAAVLQKRSLDDYDFDPSMLAVLTEYEEHRLRVHVERGHVIHRLQLRVPLEGMEAVLRELKQRIGTRAEIISLLPSSEPQAPDELALELLLASAVPERELREVLGAQAEGLLGVRRRRSPSRKPPTANAATTAPPPRDAELALVRTPPPGPAPPRAGQLSLRSLTSVVRVDIRKLDHLMNAVGELGIVRSSLARLLEKLRAGDTHAELVLEAQRAQRSFDRRLSQVQEAVLEVRMVPLSQLFDKLAVVVRQLAREQDKHVQLAVRGAETEVDKLVAEEIADPLVHLVRNAIDHGIESRQERAARGKPELAAIQIHAYQKGNHVVVEVRDDGRGIDFAAVKQTALERGLLRPEQLEAPSEQELLELIFLPGFSTSSEVSDVSGRGVGMDVVTTNVQRLGGTVEVRSEAGVSTTFVITLPITLAIISALIFSVRGRTMSLPLAAVQEVVKLEPSMVRTIDRREVMDLRGSTLVLCRLGELLRFSVDEAAAREHHVIVLLVGNRRLGVVVERLFGQQDIVIKPLGPSLRAVRGIVGATDLGDQRLVLVLDATALLDDVLASKSVRLSAGGAT
jgi:two-component system chemotaxis sensor kinase CheA